MSTRPRIRSLKPEMWADEKVGALSYPARCLLIGLITMADDEGRLRAIPTQILGHVFPYDKDAARKLEGWMADLESQRLVVRYDVAGVQYVAFRHWRRHQRINRATPSTLPAPPDKSVELNNRVLEKGADISEVDVSPTGEVTELTRRRVA